MAKESRSDFFFTLDFLFSFSEKIFGHGGFPFQGSPEGLDGVHRKRGDDRLVFDKGKGYPLARLNAQFPSDLHRNDDLAF
jgi:hypothetical protein